MRDIEREPTRTKPASLRNSRRDAAHVLCRRLWPSDRAAVQAHVLRLDPETRAGRFMAAVSDRFALAYAEQALVAEGMTVGAFVDGTLRGLGELRPAGGQARGALLGPRAEAAFVVERDFRREGLGSALFRRIVEAARSRGVADLHVRCLNGNGPMRRLALRQGAVLRAASGFETQGAIRLDRPTPFSLWSEGLAEAVDAMLAFTAAQGRALDSAAAPGSVLP